MQQGVFVAFHAINCISMPKITIRIQALVCLGKLLPNLEAWMVTEQVLPTLPKINSKEPGVLMAILGIYKLAFESESISVSKDQLAKSVLPFLIATSVENTLNLSQFEQFITLIKAIMAKVEKEHRHRLAQLSAGQEEQRGVPNFDEIMKSNVDAANGMPKSAEELGDIFGALTTKNQPAKNTGTLSLEEKKRIAAEQRGGGMGAANKQSASKSNATLSDLTSLGGSSTAAISSSGPTSRSHSPFVDLFDPMATASYTTVSTSSGKTFDISEFLPANSGQANNSSNFGVFSSNPAPSAQMQMPIQFPNSLSGGGTTFSMGLPQPPKSSNTAVQRSNPTSSLDSLLSFPPKPGSLPMNAQFAPPPSNQNTVARPPATNQKPNDKKDPFADLLG
ncbi:hypothetical protein WR25_14537 [Diploscapter pachys]|uniref:SCY1-like protein 2 n=1 Tax=Diploscapter pachys TaxID=2018661 RepID=A0A2A2JTZ1_9BILA|nr:hypothetical protein WR25_14537 [Diploscapter pachys]